jgi:hypothetical protein
MKEEPTQSLLRIGRAELNEDGSRTPVSGVSARRLESILDDVRKVFRQIPIAKDKAGPIVYAEIDKGFRTIRDAG